MESLPHFRKNQLQQSFWRKRNKTDLEIIPVANGTGTAAVHEECATCSAVCIRRRQTWGPSSTRLSMRSSTSTVRELFRSPLSIPEGWTVPVPLMRGPIAWNVRCVRKSTLNITSPRIALHLLHYYHGLGQKLSIYRFFLGMCTCPF
jgi:hypothetical protein